MATEAPALRAEPLTEQWDLFHQEAHGTCRHCGRAIVFYTRHLPPFWHHVEDCAIGCRP